MATILLRNRKRIVVAECLVDDSDFADLSQYIWCRHRSGYAHRCLKGSGSRVLMHRHIMGDPPAPGLEVDHLNRCKLDNRRCNLRWVTRSENRRNTHPRSDNVSGHKHISRRISLRTGRVSYRVWHIRPDGKMKSAGTRPTLDAALALRSTLGLKD